MMYTHYDLANISGVGVRTGSFLQHYKWAILTFQDSSRNPTEAQSYCGSLPFIQMDKLCILASHKEVSKLKCEVVRVRFSSLDEMVRQQVPFLHPNSVISICRNSFFICCRARLIIFLGSFFSSSLQMFGFNAVGSNDLVFLCGLLWFNFDRRWDTFGFSDVAFNVQV